jgi:hypothetical protein
MQIALINSSTVLSDATVQALVTSLEIQGQRDLAPAWGITDLPTVVFVGAGQKPPPGSWWLTILDNSDMAGALGYHDVTDEGLPIGKVFAGTDLQYSSSWTVTASHEFCEMLVDPSCTMIQQTAQGNAALEVCDACEDDSFGYLIDGALMSDFVTPPFFEDLAPYGSWTRFDLGGHITRPMQILTGGYLSVQNVAGNWVQINGDNVPLRHQRAPVGSRRERRKWRSHGHAWVRSLPR